MTNTLCPLCTGNRTAIKYEINASLLRKAWGSQQESFAQKGIQLRDTALWTCTDCELEFFSPPQIGDHDFYGVLSDSVSAYYPNEKWEHQAALQSIIHADCKSVIELGCGDGTFLKMAKQSGLKTRGVDFNVKASQKVDEDIIQADLNVFKSSELYDAVASFQVLEHVEKPGAFLANVWDMIKPGGLLVLAVPNRDGVYTYMPECDKGLDLPPHHASRWNRTALEWIGKKFGYENSVFLTEPLRYDHYCAMVKAQRDFLPRSFSDRLRGKIAQAFHDVLLPFYYFDIQSRVAGHTCMILFKKPLRS